MLGSSHCEIQAFAVVIASGRTGAANSLALSSVRALMRRDGRMETCIPHHSLLGRSNEGGGRRYLMVDVCIDEVIILKRAIEKWAVKLLTESDSE